MALFGEFIIIIFFAATTFSRNSMVSFGSLVQRFHAASRLLHHAANEAAIGCRYVGCKAVAVHCSRTSPCSPDNIDSHRL